MSNKDTLEGKKKAYDLIDFVMPLSEITCSKCSTSDSECVEPDFAVDSLFRKGWRATSNNVYCPACVKKFHIKK